MKNITNLIKSKFWFITSEGINNQRKKLAQRRCKHELWNCDKQIRVIECKSCGLRAHIDDYVDLFSKQNK